MSFRRLIRCAAAAFGIYRPIRCYSSIFHIFRKHFSHGAVWMRMCIYVHAKVKCLKFSSAPYANIENGLEYKFAKIRIRRWWKYVVCCVRVREWTVGVWIYASRIILLIIKWHFSSSSEFIVYSCLSVCVCLPVSLISHSIFRFNALCCCFICTFIADVFFSFHQHLFLFSEAAHWHIECFYWISMPCVPIQNGFDWKLQMQKYAKRKERFEIE